MVILAAAAGIYLYMGGENTPSPPERMRPPAPGVKKSGSPPPPRVKQPIVPPAVPGPAQAISSAPGDSGPAEDACARLDQDIRGFFHYLDGRDYLRRRYPNLNTLARYRKILARLAAHPPVPAGEGKDPRIIVQNLYHFFRVVGQKDLTLMREILDNESDGLELDLDLFYRWAVTGGHCPDPGGIRPTRRMLYRYAGFFLNTTGGRGYLFRRPFAVRLLVSYYCLLIIHQADMEGKNSEGIDIYPLILDLRTEIAHYRDFEFQKDYLDQLDRMARYYREKRHGR